MDVVPVDGDGGMGEVVEEIMVGEARVVEVMVHDLAVGEGDELRPLVPGVMEATFLQVTRGRVRQEIPMRKRAVRVEVGEAVMMNVDESRFVLGRERGGGRLR